MKVLSKGQFRGRLRKVGGLLITRVIGKVISGIYI